LCAEHDVDVRRLLAHELAVLLGEAAGDDDLAVGPGILPSLEVPEVAVELVVGVLPNAAGVEDDDVGLGLAVGAREPVDLEQAGDALGVVLVHLAPEGAHDVGAASHRPLRLPAACLARAGVQARLTRAYR
jgi:hypothetical protein